MKPYKTKTGHGQYECFKKGCRGGCDNPNHNQGSEQYEYARDSNFSNLGEDIKKSARHNYNELRNIQEAEDLGQGDVFAKKSALMKIADIDFLDNINSQNDLAKLTAYMTLNKFPDKPEIYKQFNTLADEDEIKFNYFDKRTGKTEHIKTTAGAERLKSRSQYVEAFNELKNLVLKLKTNDDVNDFIGKARKLISDKIHSFRIGDPQCGFANQLVHFYNKQLQTNTNSVSDINWQMKKLSGDERLEAIKDLISGGKKSSGTATKKPKKDKPTYDPTYAEKAERVGKKSLFDTYEKQSDFVLNKVGVRGVQYGQYITDKERQEHMANIADSISDFSDITGIPAEKLSCGGQLAISVGARGKGNATAHYEPTLKVINITKNGAGAFSHEYFHAIDDLLAKKLELSAFAGGRATYAGQNLTSSGSDPKADSQLKNVVKSYNEAIEPFIERMCRDKTLTTLGKSKFDYFVNNRQELFARIGERIVQKKLERKGYKNTYLSGSEGDVVYPNDEELKAIEPHFDSIIDYIKTKI